MSVHRIVSQQASAHSGARTVQVSTNELREQIRQIALEAQATAQDAQAAAHDAREAATLRKANAADAVRAAQNGGRHITINEHGIIVGPREPGAPGAPSTVYMGGMDNIIPPQAVDIATGFFVMCAVMVIGWPLARAFGRRIERRSETAAVNPAVSGQLQRIEQAVEAMAIEIERISESQRFMAKLQNGGAERGALPSGERH